MLVHHRGHLWAYLLLLAGGVLMMAPFIWMVSSALKPPADQFTRDLIPQNFTLENFVTAWQRMEFHHLMWNSARIAALSTIGQLITCSMGAFVFAVVKFPGRNFLFMLLLATLMLPYQMTVIPQFIIFSWLGLYGTDVPLWLPNFLGGAFGVFLLRQYFRTIPIDLMEAARLDGASLFRVYWSIYLPLAKPALAALALFAFMNSWNDLFSAMIYLPSNLETTTLPVGLSLFQRLYRAQWAVMMAAVVISIAPIIIAFFFAQKQFIQGIATSGLK
ncbi:MAG: carbohydrate ABC transporter permease [Candidatus Devosia phytovorans]|uniref:Carbohydrate ABC transporter permease n=1 Tax=Candidatus Devosia phytovorans TaxID=3121372 RepID=A0AAJ5VQJ1_9HYPH|nr:carbohydrate ABC transporter permease [Devosia sp.]WEK02908.1 MAG: carbohydrate ABC transporter permease [Devosia sp.]